MAKMKKMIVQGEGLKHFCIPKGFQPRANSQGHLDSRKSGSLVSGKPPSTPSTVAALMKISFSKIDLEDDVRKCKWLAEQSYIQDSASTGLPHL